MPPSAVDPLLMPGVCRAQSGVAAAAAMPAPRNALGRSGRPRGRSAAKANYCKREAEAEAGKAPAAECLARSTGLRRPQRRRRVASSSSQHGRSQQKQSSHSCSSEVSHSQPQLKHGHLGEVLEDERQWLTTAPIQPATRCDSGPLVRGVGACRLSCANVKMLRGCVLVCELYLYGI